MRYKKRSRKRSREDVVLAYPLEVTLDECNGNTAKMIKRFTKKVRKEEVLRPFYERLAYPTTKGQKARKKRESKKWLEQKRMSKLDENE